MASNVTVRTGRRVTVPGIYEADCEKRPQRTFPKDHIAPPCRCCNRTVNWRLIRETVTNP